MKKDNSGFSIIAILVIMNVIIVAILIVRIMIDRNSTQNTSNNYSNVYNSSNSSKDDNSKNSQYSREKMIELLQKGENYNNYTCEYELEEGKGKTKRKFKDDVLLVQSNNQIVYQDYINDKQIVINKERKTVLNTKISSKGLINIEKNYCNGISDLINNYNIKYKFIKREKYNKMECIVIRIEGNDKHLKNQFNFGQKLNYANINTSLDIWISSKSGLIAKISAKYESNTKEKYSKVIDYNLVLDNVTNDDIKEPDISGYQKVNI